MNPILKTFVAILIYITSVILFNMVLGAKGDLNFIIVVQSFYIMPVVSIFAYIFFCIKGKKWVRNNIYAAIIFGIILICWFLSILAYIHSLLKGTWIEAAKSLIGL